MHRIVFGSVENQPRLVILLLDSLNSLVMSFSSLLQLLQHLEKNHSVTKSQIILAVYANMDACGNICGLTVHTSGMFLKTVASINTVTINIFLFNGLCLTLWVR